MQWILQAAVQLLFILLAGPILQGWIKTLKARLQGRAGPGVPQPLFDYVKLLGRESVVSQHASRIFRAAPFVAFGAILTAMLLTPTFFADAPAGGAGDAIAAIALLALARFSLALAALDTGSNFAGMGTSREITLGALVEPGALLVVTALALLVPTTSIAGLGSALSPGPTWLLALAALGIVVIAETGRLPVDNPDTHLELTMMHEGMLLEYSGYPLGILFWASSIKQLLLLTLVANWFFPTSALLPAGAAGVALGVVLYLGKLAVLGAALAVVETSTAKLRILRVPALLGTAAALALLAVGAQFVVGL